MLIPLGSGLQSGGPLFFRGRVPGKGWGGWRGPFLQRSLAGGEGLDTSMTGTRPSEKLKSPLQQASKQSTAQPGQGYLLSFTAWGTFWT